MRPNAFNIWSLLSFFILHSSFFTKNVVYSQYKQISRTKTKEFLENTYSGIVKLVYLPKCRMKYVDAKGEERFRFRPMICGLLFIKTDSVKALKRILTYWGYFVYEDTVRNLETGELQKKKLVSTAHLLCKDVKDLNLDAVIKMPRFQMKTWNILSISAIKWQMA